MTEPGTGPGTSNRAWYRFQYRYRISLVVPVLVPVPVQNSVPVGPYYSYISDLKDFQRQFHTVNMSPCLGHNYRCSTHMVYFLLLL